MKSEKSEKSETSTLKVSDGCESDRRAASPVRASQSPNGQFPARESSAREAPARRPQREAAAADAAPLERVEALYRELVAHYGGGEARELRAAAKLLLVALAKFREHGGPQWKSLLDEYVALIKTNPAKFERMLASNRSEPHDGIWA